MLLGIGIDILSIARLEGMIARRGAVRLAQRICSERELVDFHALREKFDSDQLPARQLRFLCARWASKEAAFKALPPRTLSGWKDVELVYARSGRPELRLVWEARARMRERRGVREAAAAARAARGGVRGAVAVEGAAGAAATRNLGRHGPGGGGVDGAVGGTAGGPGVHANTASIGGHANASMAPKASPHTSASASPSPSPSPSPSTSTSTSTSTPSLATPSRAWAENTTDVNTDPDTDDTHAECADITLLATLSHDAGVLVAAVVAQRA